MLELIRIQNYALIENLEVEFNPGFNVLTGETGAGKSIIVGALNLILGSRASSDTIREGADRAKIEALFHLPRTSRRLQGLLDEFGIELDSGELLLSRTVTSDGRSRAYAAGTLLTLNQLAQLGDELVDLHGQHEHQSLLQPDRQLDLVDGFASVERETAQTGELVDALRAVEKEIAVLESDDRERARRVEFLKFEVAEIDAAHLQPGEEEDVRARRNLITNSEQVFTLATSAYAALYEGDSDTAIDRMDAALHATAQLETIDPQFRALSDSLTSLRAGVAAISEEIRQYTQAVEYDPAELDALNSRISLLSDLKRKFGDSIEAILAYRDKAQAEVNSFDQRADLLVELSRRRDTLSSEAKAAADSLSAKRKAAASRLDKKVTAALQDLGMKGASFQSRFEQVPLHRNGIDRLEFLLAANPGERPKPLRNVASGGEISRIMLAIKTVLASADKIPTLVFDEIDAGVGGVVANKIALRMQELARTHQTICITHLPQIAAAADNHFTVEKLTTKGRTSTSLRKVDGEGRVQEIARLLDGSLTKVSLQHAAEMLQKTAAR